MIAPGVALETAVLTCGLPSHPWTDQLGHRPAWLDPSEPINLAVVRAMSKAVREGGARPIVTAVIDGQLMAGIDDPTLERLALDETAGKASVSSMAMHMAQGSSAGTTVSGTLRATTLLGDQAPKVMATGGIGGVHVGWPETLDISADLGEIARTRTCVVCAGAKSIIDAHTTAEVLEGLGIPMLGLGTDQMPRFQSAGGSTDPEVHRIEQLDEAAEIARHHWSLPGTGGVLVTCNPPSAWALPRCDVEAAAASAHAMVEVRGAGRTPALLEAMAQVTGGATLRANVELLVANARHAADLATALH